MYRKFSWLVILLVALMVVAAQCNAAPTTEAPKTEAPTQAQPAATEAPAVAPTQPAATEAAPAAEEPFRVALVLPSPVTDMAWGQSIYDSLVRLQKELGGESAMEIAYSEGMFNVTDAAAAIRDYAANGYDLVIAHGTQYGTSLFEIAPDFPDTSFAWGTATDTGADQGINNVFAYEARAEQGGFVNGVLAASLTKSGVLGVVGPVEAGDAKLYIDGFVNGAKSANPDITVNVSYTGSFGDTSLAAEAANTHIQAGADILTGSAQQVVGAIGVAKEKGVLWMGTQADQSPLAPDIVVATQFYDWTPVLRDMMEKHQAGTMGGTVYSLTLKNGGLTMLFADNLDADAVAAAKQAEADIVAGKIDPTKVNALSGGPAPAAPSGGEATSDNLDYNFDPVRVALVLPSTTTDLAWSQSIYDSLKKIQDVVGADKLEIAYTENMYNVTDAAAAIRDYAAEGYNLVIAHGAQYGTSLFEIAPDFPDTSFAWGTTTNTGADEGVTNVFAYGPRAEQGGYVSGVLAAQLTKSGIIGVIGPVNAGDAKLHIDGFLAGVKAANPDVQVNVSFTGSFGDTSLAAEAANTHIQAGADVLTGSAQQVVGAIGVAKEKGIPWLGIQSDQSPLAPDTVVATDLYDWRATLIDMIKMNQAGEKGGKVLQLTLANGGQKMIYAASLPADAVAAAQQAEADIISGKITIPIE